MAEETVNVRYMVADLLRGNLRLLLSGPTSSAGRPMPDGRKPEPGGWNRIEFVVDNIAAEVERLRAEGVHFRNDIVIGPGGKQILLEDPSGNSMSSSSRRVGSRRRGQVERPGTLRARGRDSCG